jgi:hypothetical protein
MEKSDNPHVVRVESRDVNCILGLILPMADETILRVVVASPGDVSGERRALQDVIEGLNQSQAVQLRRRFVLCRWETDAHPGFHLEGPQGLVDSRECPVARRN